MEYRGFDRDFGLAGKVALVTGAAQGIGNAIATLFAEKGASLILVDLQKDVTEVAAKLAKGGTKAIALTGDLTNGDDLNRFVEQGIREFGRIDVLINNAGVALLEYADVLPESYWDRTMALNLKAPFMLAQRVAREMIGSKSGGRIVNIASQAAIVAFERHVAYCASKAAIVSMTQVLAVEWARHDITVNAVSPTVVLTELGREVWAGEVGEAMKKKIPAGRFGYPEEIAAAVLYLCSDAASLVTGANLVIDGGYTAQ
ncbi:MAG TPA: D-threitol dehydrogenase [Spirochaetia bacterium]|nr:D-threitol dehydrogenase [Spirochaetia bacterium]